MEPGAAEVRPWRTGEGAARCAGTAPPQRLQRGPACEIGGDLSYWALWGIRRAPPATVTDIEAMLFDVNLAAQAASGELV